MDSKIIEAYVVNEKVKDKWETLPKSKFTDKQKRFFFAIGAMRDDKENDDKVQINWSKIPKRK